MVAAPLGRKALPDTENRLEWHFKFIKRIHDQGGRIANNATEMLHSVGPKRCTDSPQKLLKISRKIEKSLAHDAYLSPASEAFRLSVPEAW
eukprot:scaffold120997_cov59-Attheya_sp.AAC.2